MSIKNLSLRYKVLSLFAVAIIFPAVFFSIVITSIGKNNLRDSIYFRQQEIAERLADRIDAQLDLHLKLLSFRNDVSTLTPAQKNKYLKSIMEKGNAFSTVFIVGPTNKKVSQVCRQSGKDGYTRNLVFRNSVSQVFLSEHDNPYVFISAPLKRKYAIVARIEFPLLTKWVSETTIGEYGQAFIVDKKGNLIAHRETERVRAGSNFENLAVVRDFIDNRESSPKRWREYFDERGNKVVALYKPISRLGWAVVTQIPAREVYKPIENMNRSVMAWTLCWTAVFLFVGLSFVRKIIDPLSLLRSGAERISRGNLDIKLNINTGDEIEDVARNFEKMAEELKKLETLKEDLTKMIIHDLKSPLTGIMGSLDYLSLGFSAELNADQKNIVDIAKKSGENMAVLLQNLLDIAKIESGNLKLKKERINMSELFSEKHKEFWHRLIGESKEFSLNVAEGIPDIEAEKNIIERVINNLVNNAIKHTTSEGKIKLSAFRENDFLKISVSDNGPGVPDEFKEKIFEKFVQIERGKSGLRTGAGLGLTFCKMAVEAHGGKIWVETEPGGGSSFIFTLPLN